METSKTYNRTINLLDKYTKFIKSIDTEDIGNNLTLDKLIELKSILSDINNIMTLISTRSIATKLSDILSFKNEDRERIFNDIEKTYMQLIITQITTVNTIERLSVFYEAKRKMEKITYLTFICTKISFSSYMEIQK